MSAVPVLTPGEITIYIQDRPELNYLLTGQEFSPAQIDLAISLALDEFNVAIQPVTTFQLWNFPSKSILLYGTLAKLLAGQAALYARNQMDYSDGGLTIPIEERYPLYQQMAGMYQTQFQTMGSAYKVNMNMQDGYGGGFSEYGGMPLW